MGRQFWFLGIPILIAVLLTGCDGVVGGPTSRIYVEIGDAAHGGPSDKFYLLPPLVDDPFYSGEFDSSLEPVVSIPDLDIEFTMESLRGAESIRVVPEDEQYIVNWHTEVFDLEIPGVYRISFLSDDEEIGYVEVHIFEDEVEVPVGDEFQTMINPGRTLPIKFRIEL